MEYVINENDILYNLNAVRTEIGEKCKIIAVLKGNAYGFGTEYMARLLKDNGVETFAVTETEDAVLLKADILKDKDILMLRSTAVPEEVEEIISCGAVATVGSEASAKALEAFAGAMNKQVRAHIKIDSGMGRYGFQPGAVKEIVTLCKACTHIIFDGIYTHFSSAFTNNECTRAELKTFLNTVEALKAEGVSFKTVHSANSSATFNVPETRLDAVRIGSAFTGGILGANASKLKRVGEMHVKVADITNIPAGHKVGYNGTFTAKRDTLLAIIPVGHTDGFGMAPQFDPFTFKDAAVRSLMGVKKYMNGQKTAVNINGKQFFTAGQIGLSHAAVDVTGADVMAGDEAVIKMSPLYVNPKVKRKYVN